MSDQSAMRRAKRPRTAIAGPYGHPFHAMLITIPIGAWSASLVFDLVAFFGDDPEAFAIGARWLVGIGLLGALLAAVFGFLDYLTLAHGTKARRTALTHMILNLSAVVIFFISFLVRLPDDDPSVAGFIISLIGIIVVGISGYLGGELAYRFGIRVADESTQHEAFEGARDDRG